MHESVMTWVEAKVKQYDLNKSSIKVLEIGSLNVNGSARTLLDKTNYWGIDFIAGPGVDEVVTPTTNTWASPQYDLIVSTEALEHDPRPHITFKYAYTNLKAQGLLLLTTRGFGYSFHGRDDAREGDGVPQDPWYDYWRFSKDAIQLLCHDAQLNPLELIDDPDYSGLFLVAQK